jgi:hypothetical protein
VVATRSGRIISGERAQATHWGGRWDGPGAGLDDIEKGKLLTPSVLELQSLCRPVRSQLLYRLREGISH